MPLNFQAAVGSGRQFLGGVPLLGSATRLEFRATLGFTLLMEELHVQGLEFDVSWACRAQDTCQGGEDGDLCLAGQQVQGHVGFQHASNPTHQVSMLLLNDCRCASEPAFMGW